MDDRQKALLKEFRLKKCILINQTTALTAPAYVKSIVLPASKVDGYVNSDRLTEVENKFLGLVNAGLMPQHLKFVMVGKIRLFHLEFDDPIPDPVIFITGPKPME